MLLQFNDITKNFGDVTVLRGISFQLDQSQVMGLVGENGAGKSTLMNILGGIHQPTSGTMSLGEKPFAPQTATDSLRNGIAFIHQELNLFPNLSLLENLYLTHFPTRRWAGIPFIDRKRTRTQARNLLQQVGLDVSPTTLVEDVTPAQRQLLEIAKALSTNPQLIIFDEPTTSLTRHEADRLFSLINQLKLQGIAMIYISHNLEDVIQLADFILVLRDGTLIRRHPPTSPVRTIINDMVGRDVTQLFPERDTSPGNETLLEVEGLGAPPLVDNISFHLKKREVLGFYGLVGAGRSEMARMLYGLDPFPRGKIIYEGQYVSSPSPEKWIKRRVAFLTEDRREEGLLLDQTIEQNVALASLPRFAQSALRWIKYDAVRPAAAEQAEATRVKYQSLSEQAVATLSGGNQQKVVLSKWLLIEPEVLIIDEPTKGIDVGAKHEIYRLINQLVGKGTSVLLISSEIEELLGMCDRILVMSQGRLSAEFERDNFDRASILRAALHNQSINS